METNKSFQEAAEKPTFETKTVRKSVMEVFEGNIPHVCEPKIKSFLAQYINNALNEKTDPEKIKAVARVFSDLNTSLKNSSIAKIIYDEFSGSKDPNTLINNIYAILIQKN
jgi:nickel-dependent lactate racemase